jgi:hypothetical protein
MGEKNKSFDTDRASVIILFEKMETKQSLALASMLQKLR